MQSRRILFVMLNPSTANATHNDPTLRRCLGFASDWGFGSLELCNLFAYRATEPAILKRVRDPVGPDNDSYICTAAKRANAIIVAWGTRGTLLGRAEQVTKLLARTQSLLCLGVTKDGAPRHPLYVPRTVTPVPFKLP